MMQRLINLWNWSKIDPHYYPLGTNPNALQLQQHAQAEIIYPNRTAEILKAKPNASLDELVA